MDEGQSIHIGVTSLSTAFTAMLTFFGRRALNDIKTLENKMAAHELDDVNKYATKAEVIAMGERLQDCLDVISQDVKMLLQRRG